MEKIGNKYLLCYTFKSFPESFVITSPREKIKNNYKKIEKELKKIKEPFIIRSNSPNEKEDTYFGLNDSIISNYKNYKEDAESVLDSMKKNGMEEQILIQKYIQFEYTGIATSIDPITENSDGYIQYVNGVGNLESNKEYNTIPFYEEKIGKKVKALLDEVEFKYQKPVIIEWGIKNKKTYLLQIRFIKDKYNYFKIKNRKPIKGFISNNSYIAGSIIEEIAPYLAHNNGAIYQIKPNIPNLFFSKENIKKTIDSNHIKKYEQYKNYDDFIDNLNKLIQIQKEILSYINNTNTFLITYYLRKYTKIGKNLEYIYGIEDTDPATERLYEVDMKCKNIQLKTKRDFLHYHLSINTANIRQCLVAASEQFNIDNIFYYSVKELRNKNKISKNDIECRKIRKKTNNKKKWIYKPNDIINGEIIYYKDYLDSKKYKDKKNYIVYGENLPTVLVHHLENINAIITTETPELCHLSLTSKENKTPFYKCDEKDFQILEKNKNKYTENLKNIIILWYSSYYKILN